jgi:hypothetical protein
MPRLAATLAGLALVGVPAAIAIASTDTASQSTTQQPMLVRQTIQNSSPSAPYQHRGRHCHRLPGDQQNGSGSDTSGV